MADQITNYKCPACTGPLHFGGGSGMMECDYCGSTFSVEEIENLYEKENQLAAEAAKKAEQKDEWDISATEWVDEGMKVYNCSSCGAELVYEGTTAASSCPYCDNPTLIPGQFAGSLKPDYVVPFKLEKDAAVAALKKHYSGKFLLPKSFSNENHIEEVKGVYVPFWLYDGKAEADGVFEGRKISKRTSGNYEITTTKHYLVRREGNMEFSKIPADASTQMPDDLMDSIEPYDYKELKPFSKAYLTGFIADKYDVSAEENTERAMERAKNSAKEALRADVTGYDEVSDRSVNVHVKEGKISYALMPVWMLSTKWQDKNYIFAMNGQSGKMVGNLPMDTAKAAITGVLSFLASIILISMILDFGFVAFLGAAIITAIVMFALMGQLNSVEKAVSANVYVSGKGMSFSIREDTYTHTTEKKEKKNN